MALNIRDEDVDRLAAQLASLRRTTKTQAVKEALEHEIDRLQQTTPLWERIAPLRAQIAAYPDNPGVVIDKAFFDDLNGEEA